MEVAEPDMNLVGDGSSQEMARMPGSLRESSKAFLGAFWELSGNLWGLSGSLLGAFWKRLGASGSLLGAFWKPSAKFLGAVWELLGSRQQILR